MELALKSIKGPRSKKCHPIVWSMDKGQSGTITKQQDKNTSYKSMSCLIDLVFLSLSKDGEARAEGARRKPEGPWICQSQRETETNVLQGRKGSVETGLSRRGQQLKNSLHVYRRLRGPQQQLLKQNILGTRQMDSLWTMNRINLTHRG